MASPVIAWLTDFGTRDHYVGTMKGVALSIAPDAVFVDITHDIAPQDILGGALELAASYRFFPSGTIFVAVVDPGVGSGRRAIAVRAGGYAFVAPDNGLLTLVLREIGSHSAVELTEPRFALPVVSRTFEGRDRFAPAAAWLARGVALEAFGPGLATIAQCVFPEAHVTPEQLRGEIVRIDRFGNAITNISRRVLDSWSAGAEIVVTAGHTVIQGIATTYAHADAHTPCALLGSTDHLEIAVVNGDASSRLGLGRGGTVLITRVAAEGRARR